MPVFIGLSIASLGGHALSDLVSRGLAFSAGKKGKEDDKENDERGCGAVYGGGLCR